MSAADPCPSLSPLRLFAGDIVRLTPLLLKDGLPCLVDILPPSKARPYELAGPKGTQYAQEPDQGRLLPLATVIDRRRKPRENKCGGDGEVRISESAGGACRTLCLRQKCRIAALKLEARDVRLHK